MLDERRMGLFTAIIHANKNYEKASIEETKFIVDYIITILTYVIYHSVIVIEKNT